jgi:hypothetical protein
MEVRVELNPVFDSAPLNAGLGIIAEPLRAGDSAIRQLAAERMEAESLFRLQPPETADELHTQSVLIAQALLGSRNSLRFSLPAQVVLPSSGGNPPSLMSLPADYLQQKMGELFPRQSPSRLRSRLRMRLADLEQSRYAGVATAARLIRFAVVRHLVYAVLPAGNPSLREPADSAAAFLPEWTAFDPEGRLIVSSVGAAESYIAQMQAYLAVLHLAISLAPYMFADGEYQFRRHHMLIQLIRQAQALAVFQTDDIIRRIRQMAAEGLLNLGLSLSLPYFDDQSLQVRLYDFPVIPGRTEFVPAFVALAARREQLRVAQAAGLSQSTRLHLLALLKDVERAFAPVD